MMLKSFMRSRNVERTVLIFASTCVVLLALKDSTVIRSSLLFCIGLGLHVIGGIGVSEGC